MPKFIPINQEDPMKTLCRMVIETEYKDLSGEVVEHVKHSILDTMAVTIGGSAMDGISAVVELVKDKGGKPESLIPFYGGKVPASEAAMAIGPMARAMSFGDLHAEGSHVSEHVFPTLLAATGIKKKVTGKEFIVAFALGQEVMVRIGIAYKVNSKAVPMGFDGGGHYIFGDVAAVGKLLGLNLEEMENAEGIARTMTYPRTLSIYSPATLMAHVHHGFIGQDAVNACILAQKGITGPRQGVLNDYLSSVKWETEPEELTRGLGEKWDLLEISTKGHVAAYNLHTSIDGISDQMEEHTFKVEDIDHIHIDIYAEGWPSACEPVEKKWHPQTVPECQFSLPYVVATAVFDGGVSLSSYTLKSRAREDIRELMTRITAKADPSLPNWASRVTTTLKDGRKYSKEYIYIKGMPQNPFTEQDFIDKFNMCLPWSAYPLRKEIGDSLIKSILSLEQLDDVVEALLVPVTPK